jgi:hypothetical protein
VSTEYLADILLIARVTALICQVLTWEIYSLMEKGQINRTEKRKALHLKLSIRIQLHSTEEDDTS